MIRPFRPSDRETLIQITTLAFDGVSIDQNIESLYGVVGGVGWQPRKASHIEADIQANPSGIFVFEHHGAILGFITCRPDRRTRIGAIPNLAVHPDHQGKGVGKQLIQAALNYLRAHGMHLVRIETLEQNRRCVALYPKMGFREVARQIHYVRPLDERG
ncbi:MAG: GNAT family N-acetyltransferase [Planctomycetes bacterium]|nr:GNAT family N-acetyltransferase [Planctomycetota bacterium]